ncbi:MAG: hypothetical protein SPJ92_05785 [Bariatricus sp.]|nr:hypothetical protein [Bariatricus sp.]
MTESERRRTELLKSAKRQGFSTGTPAIHPRYHNMYRYLYKEESAPTATGSLGTRILLSLILFAVFISSNYTDHYIWKFSQTSIANEIQAQPDYHVYLNQFLDLFP